MIAEGDWVASRVTAEGTHLGEWTGIKPTKKRISLRGINLDRVVDGLIVEHGAKRKQCKDDGIHYTRAKTIRKAPRKIIVEWSDELREVIARAKNLKPQVRQHIVARRDGKPYAADGFSTLWQRVMVEAMKNGLEERFHFHDIRAMSATETADLIEASERLGHSSPAITQRVYRRKPTRVKPLR